jgi:8-oxo-dGTP diphosphatase
VTPPPKADGGFVEPPGIEIRAAGGVVWRPTDSGTELLIVHRPRYRDWTFPKGKLDRRERWEDAALREVREETGFRCELGVEVVGTRYRDAKDRDKLVRYWAMEPRTGRFRRNAEVDKIAWVHVAEVSDRLTYERDLVVVEQFVAVVGPEK